MTFIYVVAIRWGNGTPDAPKLEAVLDRYEDWFRFNQLTWLVATKYGAQTVSDSITMSLTPSDGVLVIQVAAFTGYAPKMTWDWLSKHSEPINALSGLFGPRTPK